MTTAIIHHPIYEKHDTGPGHPEMPSRYRVVIDALQNDADLWNSLNEITPEKAAEVVDKVKELESQGYHFEAADASFDLLIRKQTGDYEPLFRLESWRVIAEKRATITCAAGIQPAPAEADGTVLAGDYTDPEYPPTLEAAVRSGVRAAERVLAAGV